MLAQQILPYAFLLRPARLKRSGEPQEVELKGWMPSEAIRLPFADYTNLVHGSSGLKLEIHGKKRARRVLFFKKLTVRNQTELHLQIEQLRSAFTANVRHNLILV